MSQNVQESTGHSKLRSAAEGVAVAALVSGLTVMAVVSTIVIATEWDGVKFFLFGS